MKETPDLFKLRSELGATKSKLEAVQKELAETRAILADQRGDLGRTDDWVAALEASGQRSDLETLLLALEWENDYDGERQCGSCASGGFHLCDCLWLRFACAVGGPVLIEILFEHWCERQVAIERNLAQLAAAEARRSAQAAIEEQRLSRWGCRHDRQFHGDALMPCAYRGCSQGFSSPHIRMINKPEAALVFKSSAPPNPVTTYTTYTRREGFNESRWVVEPALGLVSNVDPPQTLLDTVMERASARFTAELENTLFMPSAIRVLKPKVFSDATELQKPPDGENIDK